MSVFVEMRFQVWLSIPWISANGLLMTSRSRKNAATKRPVTLTISLTLSSARIHTSATHASVNHAQIKSEPSCPAQNADNL